MPFDELLKELQGQKTSKEGQTSLDELFTKSFMSKHSSCKSFNEFLEIGNFQADTLDDIRNIPDELWDRHVARQTKFADWKSMLNEATREQAKAQSMHS
ncbi:MULTISPECIES: hypothetical protein [Paenibacillus]|jgi:hypothetical protein|uniref:Uncharacterized protein n=1 Tax=Paenibacillus oceani TaxID=2772510 RepID=A0A927H3X3_9BACL|nr:hypothetical protein [Paenibacillus oceani]MBD2865939.1 hypothetical protein [Paenibacillus oceani]